MGHTLLAQYFFGPGIDLPVKVYRPMEGWRTYFTDGRHTVAAVQQVQLGGQPKATTYQYDAFGNLVSTSGDAYPQPFTFTGRKWDAETGLYYYRARYYDPVLGRFVSEDPIGFAGGDLNLYRYVGNNPVRWIDPFGLDVYVANTAQVGGLHQKIIVDTLAGPYGQSFGMASRTAAMQGSIAASSVEPMPTQPGSGIVYEDHDPIIQELRRFKSTPEEDVRVFEYLRKQIGNTGPYNVLTNSCRTYSNREFNKIVEMIESSRK